MPDKDVFVAELVSALPCPAGRSVPGRGGPERRRRPRPDGARGPTGPRWGREPSKISGQQRTTRTTPRRPRSAPTASRGGGGGGALMRQSAIHALHQQSQRSLPGCAAFHAAPVTTHHAQSEPHQRPKQRRHDGVPPQRPGEGPKEKLESDPVGVLDNEDQEDPDAGERSDRPATQFAPVRLLPIWLNRHHTLLMSRSTGGLGATVCRLEGGCFGGGLG